MTEAAMTAMEMTGAAVVPMTVTRVALAVVTVTERRHVADVTPRRRCRGGGVHRTPHDARRRVL